MSKKLLSVFVVLALALSMVPVVGLPATKANAATFDNSNLVDADGDATNGMQAVCPHCKGEAVTWTELSACQPSHMRIGYNTYNTPETAAKQHMHVFLSENRTQIHDAEFVQTISGQTVCFHLNGNTLTYRGRMTVASGSEFNVMGNGNLYFQANTTNTDYAEMGLFVCGTANIYGGVWQNANDVTALGAVVRWGSGETVNLNVSGDAHFVPEVRCEPNIGYVTLDQNAAIDKLRMEADSTLTVEGTWQGSATVVNDFRDGAWENLNSTGVYTGSLKTANGISLYADGNNDVYADAAAAVIRTDVISTGDEKQYISFYVNLTAAMFSRTSTDDVITAYANGSLDLDGYDCYVDCNGFDITVSGTGTLWPLDSANAEYDAAKCGEWTIVGNEVDLKTDVTKGNRYITVKAGDVYTTHRLDMKITHVTLKTNVAGLCYKAEYKCDATLAGRVNAYGVAISKSSMPQNLTDEGVGYSNLTGFTPVNNTVTGNSGAVTGILKDDANADNLGRAKTKLYANSYIKIDGQVLMGNDTDAKYSLLSVLQKIDRRWTKDYTNEELERVNEFYFDWEDVGDTYLNCFDLGFSNIGV